MKEEIGDKKNLITTDATANAVQVIKAAILGDTGVTQGQVNGILTADV